MEMHDCVSHPSSNFGYTKDGGCHTLISMLCRDGTCKFYKNKKMLKEQTEKCSERIETLLSQGWERTTRGSIIPPKNK